MNNSKTNLTSEIEAAVASARGAYCQLRVLNSGGIAGDREPLEVSLDRSVVQLGRFQASAEGASLDTVTRALRDIRDYRRLFPRNAAANREEAEAARKVLGLSEA